MWTQRIVSHQHCCLSPMFSGKQTNNNNKTTHNQTHPTQQTQQQQTHKRPHNKQQTQNKHATAHITQQRV